MTARGATALVGSELDVKMGGSMAREKLTQASSASRSIAEAQPGRISVSVELAVVSVWPAVPLEAA